MKAIYQKPVTETIVVTLTPLMSASKTPEKVEDGFNPNDTPTTEETSGNLSRRHDVWEEEENEY